MNTSSSPILKDLHAVITYAAERYRNEFIWQDIKLNDTFKATFRSYLQGKNSTIQYLEHTSVITTKQGQNLYVANQWFAIASYMVDFCTELLTYREYIIKICNLMRVDAKEFALNMKLQNFSAHDKSHFLQAAVEILENNFPGYEDIDKVALYLWIFVSDYSWWSGSKTVDRHDFYISPVLNKLNVVNASHEYVAEIILSYATDLHLRQSVENLDLFTVGAKSKDYEISALEQKSYEEAEEVIIDTVTQSSMKLSISISAASLERFNACR